MQDSFDSQKDNQCPICYNESKQLIELCKNDHKICYKCVFSLERHHCPFCKEKFTILQNQQNQNGFLILKGQEDKQHENKARIRQAQREHQQIRRHYEHMMLHHHTAHQHHVHNHHIHYHNIHHAHNPHSRHHIHHPADHEQNETSSQEESEVLVQNILEHNSVSATQERIQIEFVDQQGDQSLESYNSASICDPEYRQNHKIALRMARRERDQNMYDQHVRQTRNNQHKNNFPFRNSLQSQQSQLIKKKDNPEKKQLKKQQKKQQENIQNSEGGFLSLIGNFLIKLGSKLIQKQPQQTKQTQAKIQNKPNQSSQLGSYHLSSRHGQGHNSLRQENTRNQSHNQSHVHGAHNVHNRHNHHNNGINFHMPRFHHNPHQHQCTNPHHHHRQNQHYFVGHSNFVHNHSMNPNNHHVQSHQTLNIPQPNQNFNIPQNNHSGHHNHRQFYFNHHHHGHPQSSSNIQRVIYPPQNEH